MPQILSKSRLSMLLGLALLCSEAVATPSFAEPAAVVANVAQVTPAADVNTAESASAATTGSNSTTPTSSSAPAKSQQSGAQPAEPANAATPTTSAAPEAPPPALDDDDDRELPDFAPSLFWNNASSAQDFPIHWLAASNQGTLLVGSLFSKNFLAYNIYTGECKGRQTLPFPSSDAPALDGSSAIFSDMSTAITAYNSETCEENWQRLPMYVGNRHKNLRQHLPRARICRARPIVYESKIVTMNTDGLTVFYPSTSPNEGRPDFLFLHTSQDEKGTFSNTPLINRQVFYACTTKGHLHYANLNNLNDVGVVKIGTGNATDTIAREVRVPPIASSRYLFLATMDGTVHCYQLLRKFGGGRTQAPRLVWHTKLPGQHRYQSNRWGRPIAALVYDNNFNAIYANSKDHALALDADSGETIWSHPVASGIASAPIRWSKYLLLISESHGNHPAQLLALDPATGQALSSINLPGVPSSPPLLWNDYLILGYQNGYAECYRLSVNPKD